MAADYYEDREREQAVIDRITRRMNRDFDPFHDGLPDGLPDRRKKDPDERLAISAEYTAYQLGQTNRKLDKLIAAVELAASKM